MSYAVPSSAIPQCSPIYRHPGYKDGTHHGAFSNIATLYDVFQAAVQSHPAEQFLGARSWCAETGPSADYTWTTYSDAADAVRHLASGLDAVYAAHIDGAAEPGTPPDIQRQQQPLGIYADARPEWVLSELAAFGSGRYSVGISDSPSVLRAEANITSAGVQVIACSLDKIPRLLCRHHVTPQVRVLISMDALDCSTPSYATQAFSPDAVAKLRAKAAALNIALLDMRAVIELGRTCAPSQPTGKAVAVGPETRCTLAFSAGATGAQKLVAVTHAELVLACRGQALGLRQPGATYMPCVPLDCVAERCTMYALMLQRVRVGFATGGHANLRGDMCALQPAIVSATPPVLASIHADIVQQTLGARGPRGLLARAAYRAAHGSSGSSTHVLLGGSLRDALWSRLVAARVARRYGGRLQTLLCSQMHCSGEMLDMLRTSLACDVVQSYGLAETAGSLLMQPAGLRSDTVGIPLPGVDVRLRSIPDKGYTTVDRPYASGELMVRRNRPGEPLACGGWLATGDIARLRANGCFSIVDRVENILTSSLGIRVAPAPLEAVYAGHRLVHSVFVAGSPSHAQLVAVVVPDHSVFAPWAQGKAGSQGGGALDVEALCKDPRVADALRRELCRHADEAGVPPYMRLDKVFLDPKPFDRISGAYVPVAGKQCRFALQEHYKATLDCLFNSAA